VAASFLLRGERRGKTRRHGDAGIGGIADRRRGRRGHAGEALCLEVGSLGLQWGDRAGAKTCKSFFHRTLYNTQLRGLGSFAAPRSGREEETLLKSFSHDALQDTGAQEFGFVWRSAG
jgi:hypothetical protein